MANDKTTTLERTKKLTAKDKKAAKGSTSRSALPPGRIQGDWIPSTILEEDRVNLTTNCLIAEGSWRLLEGEIDPREGERVLLTAHIDRGFSLPAHPFFSGFLNFFGAQIHHFPPNTISYLGVSTTLGIVQAYFHLTISVGEES